MNLGRFVFLYKIIYMKKSNWNFNNRLFFFKDKNKNIAFSLKHITFTENGIINTSITNSYSFFFNNYLFFTYLIYMFSIGVRKNVFNYNIIICVKKLHKYI